ncbi:Kelch repeat-containing protein [Pyxidicoccus sp. 3LG]
MAYNAATGTWAATASITQLRGSHTATLLPNGRVLLVGGVDATSGGFRLESAQVYDPATGVTTAASLTQARAGHTATALLDGRVLVVGGEGSNGPLSTSEVYDANTGSWDPIPTLDQARQVHTATPLYDGRVLMVGGSGPSGAVASAELVDPPPAPRPSRARSRRPGTVTRRHG